MNVAKSIQARIHLISRPEEIKNNRLLIDKGLEEVESELEALRALVRANQSLCKHQPIGRLLTCQICGKILETEH